MSAPSRSEHCGFRPEARTCDGCRRIDYAGYPECELQQIKINLDWANREYIRAAGEARRYRTAIDAIRALCTEAEHGHHRRDAAVLVTDIREAMEDHLR